MSAEHATSAPRAGTVDMKLEVIVLPVSDVDRAKRFYAGLGWRVDADLVRGSGFRVVQLTPSASDCSIHFGVGLTKAAPGSTQGTILAVSDMPSARAELADHGVDVSEPFHIGADGPVPGPDPEGRSYFTRASFSDPDGNGWLLEEITTRLPGRIDSAATSFSSAADLASALKRAASAHGEHEIRTEQRDENWPDWYAAHMVAEQSGGKLPE